MLNAGYKKEALRKYEEAKEAYFKKYDETVEQSEKLKNQKQKSVIVIKNVEAYFNTIGSKPKSFEKEVADIADYREKYEAEYVDIEIKPWKGAVLGFGVGILAGGLAGLGVALVGNGLMVSSKNKKIALEAEQQAKEIRDETYKMSKLKLKLRSEEKAISDLNDCTDILCHKLRQIPKTDFHMFTEDEVKELFILRESALSLAKRIGEKIAL